MTELTEARAEAAASTSRVLREQAESRLSGALAGGARRRGGLPRPAHLARLRPPAAPARRGRGRHRRRAPDLQLERAALQRPGAGVPGLGRRPLGGLSRRASTSTSRPPPSGTCRARPRRPGTSAAAASRRLERRAEGAPPRRDADSTRGFHMRRILRGRAAGYALALGVVGAVVLGAWLRSPLVMLAGPAGGGRSSCCWSPSVLADRRAEEEFFLSFARARGLRYVGAHVAAAADAAARRRRPPRVHALDAGPARRGPAGRHVRPRPLHLVRAQARRRQHRPLGAAPLHDLRRRHRAGHHDVPRRVPRSPPRIWSAGSAAGWLEHRHAPQGGARERARCTSARSCGSSARRTTCCCGSSSRPRSSRGSPSIRCEPCFEYRAGTLVVYLERRLEDAGRLGWLLDATQVIAGRLARGRRGRRAVTGAASRAHRLEEGPRDERSGLGSIDVLAPDRPQGLVHEAPERCHDPAQRHVVAQLAALLPTLDQRDHAAPRRTPPCRAAPGTPGAPRSGSGSGPRRPAARRPSGRWRRSPCPARDPRTGSPSARRRAPPRTWPG